MAAADDAKAVFRNVPRLMGSTTAGTGPSLMGMGATTWFGDLEFENVDAEVKVQRRIKTLVKIDLENMVAVVATVG